MQKKENIWKWQWDKLSNRNKWLFLEWIYPNKLKDFEGKEVLDCGCGGGDHLSIIAKYCKSAVGIDLNSYEAAKKNNAVILKMVKIVARSEIRCIK